MNTLPVISLTKLKDLNGSNSGNEEHKRLYDICLEHGFFYLKDHGISADLVQQTIHSSRNFFQLPQDIKKAYGQDKQTVYPNTSRGYVPLYGETLHEEVGPDPKELFDLGIEHPPSDKPFTGPTLIPDDTVAPGFAASHYQLQGEIMTKIVPHLLRALAVALNLEPDWFDPYFDDPILIHRTIYYPSESGVAGKHTDNGIFTVLIQEYFPTPSLRVYTKNAWIDAVCLEDAFVINLGDMLQLWTNGLFVSTPHEVIHTVSRSRISIPFFVYPDVNATFEPIGTDKKINATDIMLKNFNSIWVNKTGAGRAQELK
ncbi:2-oxoglutarate and iron-dependent oxygenase domain-containing protein [Moorena sp. SIO2C4]|uniref:isopenicillin N synthase family dioxygenase n=1 Tax=Moorena sp. SIO2C4 TaxID=2607824 RepID=UPI0013C60BC7|nr:2-oxoglutarate and iron-dependent oxygenase domain-containing protein [Moorena sp. SIO2C4]NES44277.1 isopenicillin N synthase family oxygenase [Moorena sp. SIO2C4]